MARSLKRDSLFYADFTMCLDFPLIPLGRVLGVSFITLGNRDIDFRRAGPPRNITFWNIGIFLGALSGISGAQPVSQRPPSLPSSAQPRGRSPEKGIEVPRLHSALRATPFPPSPRRGHFPKEGRGKGGSAVLAETDPVRRTPKIKT